MPIVQTPKKSLANLGRVRFPLHSETKDSPIADIRICIRREFQQATNRLRVVREPPESAGYSKPDVLVGMILITDDRWNSSGVIEMAESVHGRVKDCGV